MSLILILILTSLLVSGSGLCCYQCVDGCDSCYGCWGATSACNIDTLACKACLGSWCQEVPPEPPNVNSHVIVPSKLSKNETEMGPEPRDIQVGSPIINSNHIFWTGLTKNLSGNLYVADVSGISPMLSIQLSSQNTIGVGDPKMIDADPDRIYVSHWNQTKRLVDCVIRNKTNLELSWSVEIDGLSEISVSAEGFYYTASSGSVRNYDWSGTEGWGSKKLAEPTFPPTYIDGYVYAVGSGLFLSSLYKINAFDGSVMWSAPVRTFIWNPLVVSNSEYVILCSTRYDLRNTNNQPTAVISILHSNGERAFDFTAAGVIRSPVIAKVNSDWKLFFTTCERASLWSLDHYAWTKCKVWGTVIQPTGIVIEWVYVPEHYISLGKSTYENSVLYISVSASYEYNFYDKQLLSIDVVTGNVSWSFTPENSLSNSSSSSLTFSVYQAPSEPLLSIVVTSNETKKILTYSVEPDAMTMSPGLQTPAPNPSRVPESADASLTWFYMTLPFLSFLFIAAIAAALYYRMRSKHSDCRRAKSFTSDRHNEIPLIDISSGLVGIENHGYSFIKKLGKGGFGTVFLVENTKTTTPNNNLYCLKQIEITTKRARRVADNEVNVLRNIPRHKGTIDVIESFTEGNSVYLVLPYYKRGDLEGYINENASDIPEHTILGFLLQLAEALDHLHSINPPIIHRDLKPANILLSGDAMKVVITDFGLASFSNATYLHTHAGTMAYMAPEAFDGPYDQRVDIWSLGCVLYALAIRRPNAKVLCVHAGRKNFHEDVSNEIRNKGYSALLVDNVRQMLQTNRRARPSAEEIVHRLLDAGVVSDKNQIQVLDDAIPLPTQPARCGVIEGIPHPLRVAFTPLGSKAQSGKKSGCRFTKFLNRNKNSSNIDSQIVNAVPMPVIELKHVNQPSIHDDGSIMFHEESIEKCVVAPQAQIQLVDMHAAAAPKPSIFLPVGVPVFDSQSSSNSNSDCDLNDASPYYNNIGEDVEALKLEQEIQAAPRPSLFVPGKNMITDSHTSGIDDDGTSLSSPPQDAVPRPSINLLPPYMNTSAGVQFPESDTYTDSSCIIAE